MLPTTIPIFPLPNVTDSRGNYFIGGSEDLPVKQEILRVDYNRSDKNRLWFRVTGYSSDNTCWIRSLIPLSAGCAAR